ncbi:MAG: hypothetical protein NTU53_06705 [Planctomycetota bacterium]|nr:hypothetical protein [Planctomycetota bacterium]
MFVRDEPVDLKSRTKGRLMVGTRDLGGRKSGYLIGIVAEKECVWAFEAWGPLLQFDRDIPGIEALLKSLDADRW